MPAERLGSGAAAAATAAQGEPVLGGLIIWAVKEVAHVWAIVAAGQEERRGTRGALGQVEAAV